MGASHWQLKAHGISNSMREGQPRLNYRLTFRAWRKDREHRYQIQGRSTTTFPYEKLLVSKSRWKLLLKGQQGQRKHMASSSVISETEQPWATTHCSLGTAEVEGEGRRKAEIISLDGNGRNDSVNPQILTMSPRFCWGGGHVLVLGALTLQAGFDPGQKHMSGGDFIRANGFDVLRPHTAQGLPEPDGSFMYSIAQGPPEAM